MQCKTNLIWGYHIYIGPELKYSCFFSRLRYLKEYPQAPNVTEVPTTTNMGASHAHGTRVQKEFGSFSQLQISLHTSFGSLRTEKFNLRGSKRSAERETEEG